MKWISIEQRREYYRKWRETHREELKKYQREYYRKSFPYCRAYDIEYKKNHQMEIQTRRKARYAIEKGLIKKKPCMICGKEKAEMHHFDYSKPLNVVWFCRSCHTKIHLGQLLFEVMKILDQLKNKAQIE